MPTQQALLVESIVNMPILNPDTKGKSRTFVYMGKVDLTGNGILVDWKGTADTARFIREKRIGFQAELYALALKHAGVDVHEIQYRLVTRPTTKKYKVPKRTYAVEKSGRKTAIKVFKEHEQEDAERFATAQNGFVSIRTTGNPTRDHYEQELVDWLAEDPSRVTEHPYFINPDKLAQAKWFLWNAAQQILENRRNERWMPDEGACYRYNRLCPYADVCDAVQNGADHEYIIQQQLVTVDSSHPELEGADKGHEVLTYTSLCDLARCGLFYYWKHERRLRVPHDDSTPLRLGSAMHKGLETYALCGEEAAFEAIDDWTDDNPTLGPDAHWRREEEIARARAMVRAAAKEWHIESKVVLPVVDLETPTVEELESRIPF